LALLFRSSGGVSSRPSPWHVLVELVGYGGQALFRDFCQRFAKTVAHRRREKRNFLQVARASALEVEDWPRVRGSRARLEELDRALVRGKCVRVGWSPAPGGMEDPLSLVGAEAGLKVGLEAIKREDGSVARDPALVEEEVVRYFEALFQGRHEGGREGLAPVPPCHPILRDSLTSWLGSRPCLQRRGTWWTSLLTSLTSRGRWRLPVLGGALVWIG
jgi:hypothetical protein